jgi:hypothetical protein
MLRSAQSEQGLVELLRGGGDEVCHKFILKRISLILSQKRGVLSIFLCRKKIVLLGFPPNPQGPHDGGDVLF